LSHGDLAGANVSVRLESTIGDEAAALSSWEAMIDWGLAAQLAELVASLPTGGGGERRGESRPAATGRLLDAASDSERLVVGYTGLEPAFALPVAEPVDRSEWIRANLSGMRAVLEPITERLGTGMGPLRVPLKAAAGLLLTAEVGVLVGFLAGRVLGQYEVVLIDPDSKPRLLFVEPNLDDAVRALDAEPEELVRWVALHEVTHAVQFAGVPWLREHLAGMVAELTEGLTISVDASKLAKLPSRDDLRGLVDAVRDGDLVGFVAGPRQRELIDRMQATMAVVEGHAEHVMDAVGAEVLPSLPRLRAAMDRRRETRSVLFRLVARLIGLDMKMRQYVIGKRFCDAVVQRGGLQALNRVWASPDALPTLAELEDPARWMARTAPPAAA
jgi:coenzyme F420 biosynthesis associated uncharacterized protein